MRAAMDVNAYDKPYFSPESVTTRCTCCRPARWAAGLATAASRTAGQAQGSLVSQLAAQAGNRHWQWYVDQLGGSQRERGYIGFVRGALPVDADAPDDLPTSRLFRGTGQAVSNTTLMDATTMCRLCSSRARSAPGRTATRRTTRFCCGPTASAC